jgi:hypothetical protein
MNFQIKHSTQHNIEFICSAIRLKYKRMWLEFYGVRHSDILQKIAELGYTKYYKKEHKDGFMYSYENDEKMYFMDRATATQVAKENNFPMIGSVLTSEDLW